MNGRLWKIAKYSVGTRTSRKRSSKGPKGVRAVTRIREKYNEFLKK